MSAQLGRLGLRMLIGAAIALALVGVCTVFGLAFALPLPLTLGVAGGALSWVISTDPARADHLDPPPLNLDAEYALPHAQDARVRRLEEMIHGAQPNRRMTARALARVLGEVAAERDHADPSGTAPPLSPALQALLDQAAHPDAAAHPVHSIDRRTLHHHLRELAGEGTARS